MNVLQFNKTVKEPIRKIFSESVDHSHINLSIIMADSENDYSLEIYKIHPHRFAIMSDVDRTYGYHEILWKSIDWAMDVIGDRELALFKTETSNVEHNIKSYEDLRKYINETEAEADEF